MSWYHDDIDMQPGSEYPGNMAHALGKPWVAGKNVYVWGMRSGRGRVTFQCATLYKGRALSERELECIYAAWVFMGRRLTPDEVETLLFREALKG